MPQNKRSGNTFGRSARQDELASAPIAHEVIDTSLLYEELKRRYQKSQLAIEVEFRELVNWVKIGDQLTHQVHTYPAKLLPNIAHFFVRASTIVAPGSNVLDPFCGSGTVALEASLAGHKPLVADANPLSLLITKAKTTPYDCSELRSLTRSITSKASRLRVAPSIDILNPELWYEPAQKKRLEVLKRAINELALQHTVEFFEVCFSATARKLSFADPAISVPVRLKEKEKFTSAQNTRIKERLQYARSINPIHEFERICYSNIDRIDSVNKTHPGRQPVTVVGQDARELVGAYGGEGRLPDRSVALIVTSPPYGSAQKYIRASSLSLNWLELASPTTLAELERKSIGREYTGRPDVDVEREFPREFSTLLATIETKNKLRFNITVRYLLELRDALHEMARVLSTQGRIVIVIGNNKVCGELLRNDQFCIEVMRSLGLELEIRLFDRIKSRGLLTKRNSTAAVMATESILVFTRHSK